MKSARNETSWTPPGLPAPGPGEPAVETLISVARGIARGAPWYAIAESRDLDFEEVRLWPWKFPTLWKAYYRKALALQREELAARSLNMLEAIQNSGTADEIRRAAETLLRYDTMMQLIEQKTATADERGLTPITPDSLLKTRDPSGEADERTFLPRLPVLMPRGPNRPPRRPPRGQGALPTPEAIALLRKQLKDPDPRVAHRAARTTLIHDVRMQYLEAKYEITENHQDTKDTKNPETSYRAENPDAEPGALSADMRQGAAMNEEARENSKPLVPLGGLGALVVKKPPVVHDTS